MRLAVLVAILGAACSSAGPRAEPASPAAGPRAAVASPRELAFALTWNGELVGAARESFARHGDGHRLLRRERVRVGRGDATVDIALDIEIVTGADLVAHSVVVSHRDASGVRIDRARREGDRWRVDVAGEPTRFVAGDAVPAELVPHLEDRAFRGTVLLSGRAFAEAELTVSVVAPRRVRARLVAGGVAIASDVELDDDGAPERVVGPGPLGARRVATAPALPTTPPDIVAGTAIPIATATPPDVAGTAIPSAPSHTLRLVGVDRAPPPPLLPGQHVTAKDGTWHITFSPAPPLSPSRARELRTLVAIVGARLDGDLGHTARSGAEALTLARGDCNAHALLFAELARARGHVVRVVTGFRRDGDRLLRHRWAMVKLGDVWIPVDPTFAEIPARPGALLGLAAHGTTAADLALANLAYAGTETARAE